MAPFLIVAGVAAVAALVFAFVKYGAIMKADAGDSKMQEISKQVQDGALPDPVLVGDDRVLVPESGSAIFMDRALDLARYWIRFPGLVF